MNARLLRSFGVLVAMGLAMSAGSDAIVFEHPPAPTAPLFKSSWAFPDGFDDDTYCYDSFTVGETVAITDVTWQGGYLYNHMWGRVNDFSVTFYQSAAGTTTFPVRWWPDTEEEGALAQYEVGNNAGELGLDQNYYQYSFTLPEPLTLEAGVTYWIRIEGYQTSRADWGIASSNRGNNIHVWYVTSTRNYRGVSGDLAFQITSSVSEQLTISAAASLPEGGVVSGSQIYAPGATVYLSATPYEGYVFAGWEENGVVVSEAASYVFTATESRNLQAVFAPEASFEESWMVY